MHGIVASGVEEGNRLRGDPGVGQELHAADAGNGKT
jgi:hypothetical protein